MNNEHSILTPTRDFTPLKLKGVCVCVCVCEREREKLIKNGIQSDDVRVCARAHDR